MTVMYTVRLSDDYVIEAQRRHRERKAAWRWRWPIKIVCGLGLVALLGLGIWIREIVVIALPGVFLVLLLLGPRIDYFVIRRRWRRVPQFNEELKVEVSEAQISSTSPKGSGISAWSNYMRAVEHRDGIMLYNTPWNYFWLPDSGIASGTAEQTRAIVRTAIPEYHVVWQLSGAHA